MTDEINNRGYNMHRGGGGGYHHQELPHTDASPNVVNLNKDNNNALMNQNSNFLPENNDRMMENFQNQFTTGLQLNNSDIGSYSNIDARYNDYSNQYPPEKIAANSEYYSNQYIHMNGDSLYNANNAECQQDISQNQYGELENDENLKYYTQNQYNDSSNYYSDINNNQRQNFESNKTTFENMSTDMAQINRIPKLNSQYLDNKNNEISSSSIPDHPINTNNQFQNEKSIKHGPNSLLNQPDNNQMENMSINNNFSANFSNKKSHSYESFGESNAPTSYSQIPKPQNLDQFGYGSRFDYTPNSQSNYNFNESLYNNSTESNQITKENNSVLLDENNRNLYSKSNWASNERSENYAGLKNNTGIFNYSKNITNYSNLKQTHDLPNQNSTMMEKNDHFNKSNSMYSEGNHTYATNNDSQIKNFYQLPKNELNIYTHKPANMNSSNEQPVRNNFPNHQTSAPPNLNVETKDNFYDRNVPSRLPQYSNIAPNIKKQTTQENSNQYSTQYEHTCFNESNLQTPAASSTCQNTQSQYPKQMPAQTLAASSTQQNTQSQYANRKPAQTPAVPTNQQNTQSQHFNRMLGQTQAVSATQENSKSQYDNRMPLRTPAVPTTQQNTQSQYANQMSGQTLAAPPFHQNTKSQYANRMPGQTPAVNTITQKNTQSQYANQMHGQTQAVPPTYSYNEYTKQVPNQPPTVPFNQTSIQSQYDGTSQFSTGGGHAGNRTFEGKQKNPAADLSRAAAEAQRRFGQPAGMNSYATHQNYNTNVNNNFSQLGNDQFRSSNTNPAGLSGQQFDNKASSLVPQIPPHHLDQHSNIRNSVAPSIHPGNNFNNTFPSNNDRQSNQGGSFGDNMPNPIIERRLCDAKYSGVTISHHVYADLPPLHETEYTFLDEGVSNPNYILSNYYLIPSSSKVRTNISIPLGIVVQPFAELPDDDMPILSSVQGKNGPVRCSRCRAYINPQTSFINGGKSFVCNFCKVTNEVPEDYFCYLDNSGNRLDKFSRPELCRGSYELSVNNLYCRNNTLPNVPVYIFLFNVSRTSFSNGLIPLVADILQGLIPDQLRTDNEYIDNDVAANADKNSSGDVNKSKVVARVAFIAYDTKIYFFNIKSNLASKPNVEVCVEVNNSFVPSYKGFVIDPLEFSSQINDILNQLPSMFCNTSTVDTILGPAIECAANMLKNNNDCGRLFVFHSMIPHHNCMGKLDNRERNEEMGTEKENALLKPNGDYYNNLAKLCAENGVSVNLFLTTTGFIDIATLRPLCELTGGHLFYYPFFDSKSRGKQFSMELSNLIIKPCFYDTFVKLRLSNGLSVVNCYGSFYQPSFSELQIAAIDSESTIAFELDYDEDLKPSTSVSVQFAVLFTSSSGQRRLRVHNIYLNQSTNYSEIYKSLCGESTACYLLKKYSGEILKSSRITHMGDALTDLVSHSLCSYIKFCKEQQNHFQQLVLPDTLKIFPLYLNSMIKSDAFLTRKELGQDGRSYAMYLSKTMSIGDSLLSLYPTIINFHDVLSQNTITELTDKTKSLGELGIINVRCDYGRLQADQVYLLMAPRIMFLWFGKNVNKNLIRDIFGVASIQQIDGVTLEHLPALDNECSSKLRNLVKLLRKHYKSFNYPIISVVIQDTPTENLFRQYLVENKSPKPKSFSYVEFLCFIHKSVTQNL